MSGSPSPKGEGSLSSIGTLGVHPKMSDMLSPMCEGSGSGLGTNAIDSAKDLRYPRHSGFDIQSR